MESEKIMSDNQKWIDSAWETLTKKVEKTSRIIGVGTPNMSEDGRFMYEPKSFWTKGFWPGILWCIYDGNGNQHESMKTIAIECENQLDKVLEEFYMLHHDNGFVWSLSSVAQYKLFGNPISKRRALTAASHLAGRFNIKGNFIRAWNQGPKADEPIEGWAIIDCLMNLPLLHWASEETGDPRFKHIAKAHADTVLKYFIRPDGSSQHITCFDPETGELIGYKGGQGYEVGSAWARGTSWALYGMALSYRCTKEERYLESAKKTARFWMESTKEDIIPIWDFRAPADMRDATDTSAAACAACGFLELGDAIGGEEGEEFRAWGEKTLKALFEQYGTWDKDEEGLLLGGTFNYMIGAGINRSLIYGDYFFTEGMYRLKGNTTIFW